MSSNNSLTRAGQHAHLFNGAHSNEPQFSYQQLLLQADQAMVSPACSLCQHKLREQQKRDELQRGFAAAKHVRNEQNMLLNDNKENFEELHPTQMPPIVRPKLLKDSETEQRSYKELLKNLQTKHVTGNVAMTSALPAQNSKANGLPQQVFTRSHGPTNKRSFGDDITNRMSHEGKSIGAMSGAAIIHPNLAHLPISS